MNDPVSNPSHYTQSNRPFECIELAELYSFCMGNAIKYVWRHRDKHGVEDLRKAQWYLNRAREQGEDAMPVRDQQKAERLLVELIETTDQRFSRRFWISLLVPSLPLMLESLDALIYRTEHGLADGKPSGDWREEVIWFRKQPR